MQKIEPEAPSNVLMLQKSNDFLLHDVDVKSQLVVWKKPDSSLASFNKWIKRFNNKYQTSDGKGVQQEYCKCSDSTLRLLYGSGVATYIQGTQ